MNDDLQHSMLKRAQLQSASPETETLAVALMKLHK